MIVVSDSSPLIALLAVDRIELLKHLFGEITIPPAVRDEVFGSQPGRAVAAPDFALIESPLSATSIRFLRMNLQLGESEAIALALEKRSALILLDDKSARETADRLGIRVLGTLGVLMLAKQKGQIDEVRPLIIQMIDRINFRISPAVLNRALARMNEPLL